ncbi:MAG: 5'/3'-nucleotidase SurE [Polyangiaceae bacterium]|nr:5'/3'-nucleotidase SurE [Polyangiaceae bacterium]
MRPLVLLSNDDGYLAPGLLALREALTTWADVVVCAPELNQSATSHSLSLHRPLRMRSLEGDIHVVDGTPADCVYVALSSEGRVLSRVPDLCVSGMNHGLNLGVDVFYSGTVAAAREAALRGIPSVAVSADTKADRAAAAALGSSIARAVLEQVRETKGEAGLLFNVNVPPGSAWSVRATKLGRRTYAGDVLFRRDPRGAEYMWIGGGEVTHHDAPGSDTEAYDAGAVGVTPLALHLDLLSGMSTAELVARAVAG